MLALTQKFVAVKQVIQLQFHSFSIELQLALGNVYVILFVRSFHQIVIVYVRECDSVCGELKLKSLVCDISYTSLNLNFIRVCDTH